MARILILFMCVSSIVSAPQSQIKVDSSTVTAFIQLIRALRHDPNVMKLVKNVQQNFLKAAIKGLSLGSVRTEQKMELNLLNLLNEFAITARVSNDPNEVAKKLKAIEKTMYRDKQSIEILSNAMDLVKRAKTIRDYRETMKDLVQHKADQKCSKLRINNSNNDVEKMIKELHERIKQHLTLMREKVHSNDLHVNSYSNLPKPQQKGKEKLSHVIRVGSTTSSLVTVDDIRLNEISKYSLPQLYVRMPISNYFYHPPATFESFHRYRRQNNEDDDVKIMKANQSEDEGEFDDEFASNSGDAGGNGILGIIAGLSSNEGADVGALAGLISTVVTNLLGPDGLDIPSLLSTGTSLIAGLLSGDENFGAVVASYLGLAIEGFSGGGGAENNGIFFGNFVGTFFNYLFADPEEEEGPKPDLFFKSFKEGFDQTKQKRGTDEMSTNQGGHKSYFFEFISNIISSLVGGITNFVLNASLGSSGGSSQGSANLSAGSSQGSSSASSSSSSKPQPKH